MIEGSPYSSPSPALRWLDSARRALSRRLLAALTGLLSDPPPPPPMIRLLPLPLDSGPVLVEPGAEVHVSAWPQTAVFRGERLVLSDPEGWTVRDVIVGRNSSYLAAGDIPAVELCKLPLKLDTCNIGMRITVVVVNTGKVPARFVGALHGEAGG